MSNDVSAPATRRSSRRRIGCFNKTLLDEFYRVAFRNRLYRALDERQAALDTFLEDYNTQRPHQGRWCYGKPPMQTCIDSVVAKEKQIA